MALGGTSQITLHFVKLLVVSPFFMAAGEQRESQLLDISINQQESHDPATGADPGFSVELVPAPDPPKGQPSSHSSGMPEMPKSAPVLTMAGSDRTIVTRAVAKGLQHPMPNRANPNLHDNSTNASEILTKRVTSQLAKCLRINRQKN